MANLYSQYASGQQFTAGTITGSALGVSGLNPIVDRLNSISDNNSRIIGSIISGTSSIYYGDAKISGATAIGYFGDGLVLNNALDMQNNSLFGLGTPTGNDEAAPKSYVDGSIGGKNGAKVAYLTGSITIGGTSAKTGSVAHGLGTTPTFGQISFHNQQDSSDGDVLLTIYTLNSSYAFYHAYNISNFATSGVYFLSLYV